MGILINLYMMRRGLLFVFFGIFSFFNVLLAQEGTIRGNLFDKETGEPIIFANVILENTTYGVTTDIDGFFNLANIPAGK